MHFIKKNNSFVMQIIRFLKYEVKNCFHENVDVYRCMKTYEKILTSFLQLSSTEMKSIPKSILKIRQNKSFMPPACTSEIEWNRKIIHAVPIGVLKTKLVISILKICFRD